MPPGRQIIVVLGAGLALGVFSRASDVLPIETRWLGNLGGVWLVVAFMVGAQSRKRGGSALAGAATLMVAALVHYGSMRLWRYGRPDLLRYPAPQWASVGAALGGLFGCVGSQWRNTRRRTWAVGILGAALGSEALYLAIAHEPNARPLALPVEIVAFLALPIVFLRSAPERLRALGWSLALAPLGAAVISGAVAIAARIY